MIYDGEGNWVGGGYPEYVVPVSYSEGAVVTGTLEEVAAACGEAGILATGAELQSWMGSGGGFPNLSISDANIILASVGIMLAMAYAVWVGKRLGGNSLD